MTAAQEKQNLNAILNQRVSLAFDDARLSEVCQAIAKQFEIDVLVDGRAADRRVTLNANRPLGMVLAELTEIAEVHYKINGRSLQLFHEKPPSNRYLMMVYNVADLVVPVEKTIPTTDEEVPQQPRFAELVELIKTTVAPNSWSDHGGRVSPNKPTMGLVIRQTTAIHEEITALLVQLREAQDLQIQTKFSIQEFTTPEELQWLEQNVTFQPRKGHHPWALLPLLAGEAQPPSLQQHGTILSAPQIMTPTGQTANLEVSAIDSDNSRLQLESTATPLKSGQLLQLTYAASVTAFDQDDAALPAVTQIVGDGQTLLLDLTGSVTTRGGRSSPPKTRQSRVILAITPTIVGAAK